VLLAIYASTREAELQHTGWSPAQCEAFVRMQYQAQQQHYWQHHPQSLCQLILGVDGRVAGRLWVVRQAGALHVLDISLLPFARGQGLGTRCLQGLMAQAGSQGLSVSVFVEVHNPAQHLYQRLGFTPEGEPQGVHQRMTWQPAPQANIPQTTPEECLP
jgi:ribosomal protein S18 acetylase RimI-like enzyme